jgi:hypothetical protein
MKKVAKNGMKKEVKTKDDGRYIIFYQFKKKRGKDNV